MSASAWARERLGKAPTGWDTDAVIYLGGYSSQGGQGIGVAAQREGVLALASIAGCPDDPTFLAVAPGGRTLYAVHELADGLVSAFAIGDDGRLRLLGTRGSGGALPIHVSVHPSGRYLLCANWGSGSFAVLPIDADSALGEAAHVVEHPKPYAHMMTTDPAGRWVLAVHYGAGSVFTYRLDLESGRLRPQSQAHLHPGAGPRHFAFHPGGAVVYVVNEADSTVTACGWDPDRGRLEPGETVRTVPAEASVDNYPSAVLVSPDGRFVYVANRFHDSVGVLATEPSLRLIATYPCGGEFPRDMALGDGGRLLYVANERADLVTGLVVDPVDGSLVSADWAITMPRPTCVLPI
jgi:6-phosphogluconolactonase